MAKRTFSIWFFIGVSLLGNGILILGAGIAELLHPPAGPRVTLYQLHANVWWGAVLTVLGAVYCLTHRPGKAGR